MDIIERCCDGDEMEWNRHLYLVNPDDADFYDHCFLLWSEDCFSPNVYMIWAEHFQDAYDEYLETPEGQLHVIDEVDMPDYLDEHGEYQGNYNCSGQPVDTESINGREVY